MAMSTETPHLANWPAGQFATIVVDPPWKMGGFGFDHHYAASKTYQLMPLSEIAARPVDAIAAPDSHLFLWTTGRFLPDAIAMLPAWGFQYKYPLVWQKNGGPQLPGGPSFNCEYIVYGRRGKARFTDTRDFFTCFYAPRGRHSEKPAAFYRLVARITPAPRIDLFARKRHPGFNAWGDEVETEPSPANPRLL